MAVGLSSGHCRLLDARSGSIIANWRAHDGYITKVCMVKHDDIFAVVLFWCALILSICAAGRPGGSSACLQFF